MNAAAAKRHCEALPATLKQLIQNNDVSHFQHYEQPDCVDRNVGDIATWPTSNRKTPVLCTYQ